MEDLTDHWVYCDTEGDLHVNSPDPYGYGPQYQGYGEGTAWQLRIDPNYGEAKLWFYTCPGPHYKVWKGAETKLDQA